ASLVQDQKKGGARPDLPDASRVFRQPRPQAAPPIKGKSILSAPGPRREANVPNSEIEQLSIDTIRTLSMDAVQQAKAGHPGTAMALAPLAYLLYTEVLRHNPASPRWPNRDRFILSAGHACVLQYSALHLSGYNL